MFTRIYLSFVLLAAMPVWSQVTVGGLMGGVEMQTPPPVSDGSYSVAVGSETRSNYLHAGLAVGSGYTDNVLPGTQSKPISDFTYTIRPMIALDQTTSRLHQTFTYSPGFTFYQRTSSMDEIDHSVALDFQYRLSPHVTANVRENFQKSSNVLNQPNAFSGEQISGSAQSPLTAVIAPVANQLNNTASTQLTYQFARNGMVGASGTFVTLHYLEPTQAAGLSDSNFRGGAAFYSHRMARGAYFGATYQYSQILASFPNTQGSTQIAANSETQTHSFLLFYTMYLKPNLSLSLSGGPQYFDVSQAPLPAERSWTPAVTASLGWQGRHTSFAASYERVTTAGGGLVGAYYANGANASARWQASRTWTLGSAASYVSTKNVSQATSLLNPGGQFFSATVMAQHPISERFNLEVGYIRLHQNYDSIAVISNAPDANREYISISYQFTRPLGR